MQSCPLSVFSLTVAVETNYEVVIGLSCFIIYDHETGIAHECASTYFQCGPFH